MSSLPLGWEEKELSEITSLLKRGISPKYTDEQGTPVINQKCIRDFKINTKLIRFTDSKTRKIQDEKFLRNGDVLVNSTGVGTLGRVAQVFNISNITADSHVMIVRPIELKFDLSYFGYLLKIKQRLIESLGEGSTGQTELSRIMLGKIKIRYVINKDEQKRIADILSAFDDKIELNNQMNQTLESTSQALFKEWFENFNFPNEQGKAYKENGGEMKPSELGDIPIDWEIQKLDNLVSMKYGKMPKKNDLVQTGYPVYSGYRVSGFHKEYLYKNSELIVVARGVGGTGDVKFSPKKAWITNLSIVLPLSDERIKHYLFYVLTNKKLRYLDSGSAQSQITIGDLNMLKLTFPNDEILDLFYIQIKPIFEQIQQNQQQNQTLKKQRDALFPKLMSGEIRV
jgi:type I restriction enzyme S subunit